MSNPKQILDKLEVQLKNDNDLSDKVKSVLIGVRDSVTRFPVVFIEPVRAEESDNIRGRQEIFMNVLIAGYVDVKNKNDQFGELLELENAIKKAISSDRTLDGEAIDVTMPASNYSVFENHPIRGVEIEARVRYRQGDQTRT